MLKAAGQRHAQLQPASDLMQRFTSGGLGVTAERSSPVGGGHRGAAKFGWRGEGGGAGGRSRAFCGEGSCANGSAPSRCGAALHPMGWV